MEYLFNFDMNINQTTAIYDFLGFFYSPENACEQGNFFNLIDYNLTVPGGEVSNQLENALTVGFCIGDALIGADGQLSMFASLGGNLIGFDDTLEDVYGQNNWDKYTLGFNFPLFSIGLPVLIPTNAPVVSSINSQVDENNVTLSVFGSDTTVYSYNMFDGVLNFDLPDLTAVCLGETEGADVDYRFFVTRQGSGDTLDQMVNFPNFSQVAIGFNELPSGNYLAGVEARDETNFNSEFEFGAFSINTESDSISFIEQVIATTPFVFRFVYSADLDNDGDMDVLSASHDKGLFWYENDGSDNPNFTEHTISTDDSIVSVHTTDLDNDGDMDVLSAGYVNFHRIAWHENNNQTFTEHPISTTTDRGRSVYAADLDNDGDMDVLSAFSTSIAGHGNNIIHWYENNNQTFTEHAISISLDPSNPITIYAADLDNDGDMDVLSGETQKIAWYENDGLDSPNFTERVISTNVSGGNFVYATDLDCDGDVDVLCTSRDDNELKWYENNNQTFTEHIISTNALSARSIYAADLDNDGDMDVLSASNWDNKIAWYENNNQTFTEHIISTNVSGAYSVYAADLDNDGDMDVLGCGSTAMYWYKNNLIP
jgi:hypothetical protein